jgi:hypothetical protein
MPYDHIVAADVLTALDPANPRRAICTRSRRSPAADGTAQTVEPLAEPFPLLSPR